MTAISKYHGCGNDFLLMMDQPLSLIEKKQLVCHLCDRHTGIGADGFIFVHDKPLTMEFYNCDGSIAPMCGNGIRCFAKYVYDEGICRKKQYTVHTLAQDMIIQLDCEDPFLVSVLFPKPSLDPAKIKSAQAQIVWEYPMVIEGQTYLLDTCFATTIHTLLYVSNINDHKLETLGHHIHMHSLFKEKTNVNFIQVMDRCHILVRTYERGVGMTLACGSGCCAAAWDAFRHGFIDKNVKVHLPKGSLHITIHDDETITMQGGAKRIMKGEVDCI